MNKDEIKKILPHREPMLLLESAELSEDGIATGYYTVKGDEFFLQGHFPGNPIVPGVIQLEMMAQTCAVLLQDKDSSQPLYTGLDKVRFRGMVQPGDTLRFECHIARSKHPFYFAEGKGYVDDKLCVQASFSFALA